MQSVTAWAPDVHIVSDARTALTCLINCVAAMNERRENRQAVFEQIKAANEEKLGQILAPQRAYTKPIREAASPSRTRLCFLGNRNFGLETHAPKTRLRPKCAAAETERREESPPIAGLCRLFGKSPRSRDCVVGPAVV
jgi:hypothetical protein